MTTPITPKQSTDDGKQYVIVKAGDDTVPTPDTATSSTGEVKGISQCPEILYKVQYKDFSGDIKGTKELTAPYKLKKTEYGDFGIPILEVLYSVTVWFPTIYTKGRGIKKKETAEDFDAEKATSMSVRWMKRNSSFIPSPSSKPFVRLLTTIRDSLSSATQSPSRSRSASSSTIAKSCRNTANHATMQRPITTLVCCRNTSRTTWAKRSPSRTSGTTNPTPVATFEMLWMLFKPGMDVYSQIDGQRGGFVLQSCQPVTHNSKVGRPMPLKVLMWYLDFDGRVLGRRQHEVTLAPFEGEREITSLKVFPASYLDRDTDASPRKKLEDRGEKFYSMLLGKQMDYKGFSMAAKQRPKRYHEGRVVVDQGSFYTYADWGETDLHPAPTLSVDDDNSGILVDMHYDCCCNDCMAKRSAATGNTKWGGYENIDPRGTPSLNLIKGGVTSRHRYFLCPRRIMGFDLKSKKWQALDVDCCQEPEIKIEAIENLVLPPDNLELIKALVHKFTSGKKNNKNETTWAADPIPHKGEGQIFLLHGPPGAGKTFTAECVAEFTSRPLLSLTCGDIGTDEYQVEESLSNWFKLAEIWGAVMLIDEADVYLERREVNELQRNGLVSVFLRAMEYYRGILFLTTNRVGHFDPAFFSRIHVYIGYKPLDAEGRKRIWLQFFRKLEAERAGEVAVKSGAKRYILSDDVLKDIEWNGREIRNAFQTAVALAEYEATQKRKRLGLGEDQPLEIELRQDHFEKVVEMSDNFKKYLSTVGPDMGSEATKAKNKGDRGDDELL